MSWHPPFTSSVYVVCALCVVAGLGLAYHLSKSRSRRRWLYLVPRAAVLLTLLVLMCNPIHELERVLPPRPARALCLLDASRSMGLERPETRLSMAKYEIAAAQQNLANDGAVELQLYQFGAGLRAIPSLQDVRAEQDASDLVLALRQAAQLFSNRPPQAVVVFSDGTLSDAERLDEVAAFFQTAGIPIHVVPSGSQGFQGDVSIAGLAVPRGAKAGDEVPVHVTLRSYGYDGARVLVTARALGFPQAEPIVELPVTLDGNMQSFDLVVPADPQTGPLELQVSLLPEEAIVENNRVPFQLIAAERKVRVFYMEGTTHGREWSWVHNALQEDPRIECVTATLDDQYSSRPRIFRIDDPYRGFPSTRQELFEYDVVICSDISRGAFTRDQLAWTRELVADRGGGFVMVGGNTAFGAGGWDQTEWDQLIPLDMRGGQLGRGYFYQSFKVQVPTDALDHPIWRIVDDQRANREILERMPMFYGSNIAQRVKPAATLLGISSTPFPQVGTAPIFSCQSYGRGRSFAMLTDTTEGWGAAFERNWGENDNRYFRKFWRNVVYWLAENSAAGRKRVVAESDKQIYRIGESILLQARTYDAELSPFTGYRVEAELVNARTPNAGRVDLTAAGDHFQGRLTAAVPRQDRDEEVSTLALAEIEVRAYDGSELIGVDTVQVQILNDSEELLDAQPNHACLAALAEATGGRSFATTAELIATLRELPQQPGERVVHRVPIWDRAWVWLLLIGMLAVEWGLRRIHPV